MKRVCPACARRTAELVDPECPVCKGDGTLAFHPAAMSFYDPEVVAEAVVLGLEAVARELEATTTLSDDRRGLLESRVQAFVSARIIYPPGAPVAPQPDPQRPAKYPPPDSLFSSPDVIQEAHTGVASKPYDRAVVHAAPHVYAQGDRPMMRGLPVLSANGHPSHLARIADPQDVDASTAETASTRRARTWRARALVEAIPLVPQIIAKEGQTA